MFFLFGRGTTNISTTALAGVACGSCGTVGAVLLTVYSRYLHVFWIPVIPIGKAAVSQCTHCKQVLSESQMPPAYRQQATALKQQARLPLTNYLVLAILGAVIAFSLVASLFR